MSKYSEIMEHVAASDEIRSRVLANVDKYFEKRHRRAGLQRYIYSLGTAAAAVIVIGGLALGLHGLNPGGRTETGGESAYETEGVGVAGDFYVTDCQSAVELEKIVGFNIPEITNPPFNVKQTAYTAIGNNLAQIIYYSIDGNNELVLRKSPGADDISGDYNVYAENENINVNGTEVSIKGNEGKLYLACWSDGNYSYSLLISSGCDGDIFTELLEDLINGNE